MHSYIISSYQNQGMMCFNVQHYLKKYNLANMNVYFKKYEEGKIEHCSLSSLLTNISSNQGIIGLSIEDEQPIFSLFFHSFNEQTGYSELRRYAIRLTYQSATPYYTAFDRETNDFSSPNIDTNHPRIEKNKHYFLSNSEVTSVVNHEKKLEENAKKTPHLSDSNLSIRQQDILFSDIVAPGLWLSFYQFIKDYILPLTDAELILHASISNHTNRSKLLESSQTEYAKKACDSIYNTFLSPNKIRFFLSKCHPLPISNNDSKTCEIMPTIGDITDFFTHCIQETLSRNHYENVSQNNLIKYDNQTRNVPIDNQSHRFEEVEIEDNSSLSGIDDIIFRCLANSIALYNIYKNDNENEVNITQKLLDTIEENTDFSNSLVEIYQATTDLIQSTGHNQATKIISYLPIYNSIDALYPREHWAGFCYPIFLLLKDAIEKRLSIDHIILNTQLLNDEKKAEIISSENPFIGYLKAHENIMSNLSGNTSITHWTNPKFKERLEILNNNQILSMHTFQIICNDCFSDTTFCDFVFALIELRNNNILLSPVIIEAVRNFNRNNKPTPSLTKIDISRALTIIACIIKATHISQTHKEQIIQIILKSELSPSHTANAFLRLFEAKIINDQNILLASKAKNISECTETIIRLTFSCPNLLKDERVLKIITNIPNPYTLIMAMENLYKFKLLRQSNLDLVILTPTPLFIAQIIILLDKNSFRTLNAKTMLLSHINKNRALYQNGLGEKLFNVLHFLHYHELLKQDIYQSILIHTKCSHLLSIINIAIASKALNKITLFRILTHENILKLHLITDQLVSHDLYRQDLFFNVLFLDSYNNNTLLNHSPFEEDQTQVLINLVRKQATNLGLNSALEILLEKQWLSLSKATLITQHRNLIKSLHDSNQLQAEHISFLIDHQQTISILINNNELNTDSLNLIIAVHNIFPPDFLKSYQPTTFMQCFKELKNILSEVASTQTLTANPIDKLIKCKNALILLIFADLLNSCNIKAILLSKDPFETVKRLVHYKKSYSSSWCCIASVSYPPPVWYVVDSYNQNANFFSESSKDIFYNCMTFNDAVKVLHQKVLRYAQHDLKLSDIVKKPAFKTLIQIGAYSEKNLIKTIEIHQKTTTDRFYQLCNV